MEASTIQIPKDVIEPIIQAHVSKAVAEALGGQKAILEKAVSFAMNLKVDRDGKPTTYSDAQPWLAWQISNLIREAAKKAIIEHLEDNKDVIKAQLVAQLRNTKSKVAHNLADAMIDGVSKSVNSGWNFTVTCGKE